MTKRAKLDWIDQLRSELQRQWETNHAKECGGETAIHDGPCWWPRPAVLPEIDRVRRIEKALGR